MKEKYDKRKFHGNLIVDEKCKYSWSQGDFCLHQFWEIPVKGVKPEFIIKRDFGRCSQLS
jgi:hypothetical protein